MNLKILQLNWIKPLVFVVALLPLVLLMVNASLEQLGANPAEKILHETGIWALRFLLLTLLITPLRRLTGWHDLLRLRRMLGLYSFFYACLHFLSWLLFDHVFAGTLAWQPIVSDIIKRPYITVGFFAFVLLLPLAITSNAYMMRYLGGRAWQRLHRAVYLIAIAAVIHFWWLVKLDISEPVIYAVILAILLFLRRYRAA